MQKIKSLALSSNELDRGSKFAPPPPPKIGSTNTPPKIGLNIIDFVFIALIVSPKSVKVFCKIYYFGDAHCWEKITYTKSSAYAVPTLITVFT